MTSLAVVLAILLLIGLGGWLQERDDRRRRGSEAGIYTPSEWHTRWTVEAGRIEYVVRDGHIVFAQRDGAPGKAGWLAGHGPC